MTTSANLVLIPGIDTYTLLDLLKLAARHKGLELWWNASKTFFKPIKKYTLDDRLLDILESRNIKREPRPDLSFTLVDQNPQEITPGHRPSNYWSFKLLKGSNYNYDLLISLSVRYEVSTKKQGIILLPLAIGTVLSPADHLPNLRMFQALVESDRDAPAIAKEIAGNASGLIVTWSDLGLGGIRRLTELFHEFTNRNVAIENLSRQDGVFSPTPHPYQQQLTDELFITELAQLRILKAWRNQLEAYRNSHAP